MSNMKLGFIGSIAALAMAMPAAAQGYGYDNGYNSYNGYDNYDYQQPTRYNSGCDAAKRSNQTAGGVLGAVAGGLIGAAIADDDDDNHRRRGHRYSRGWDRGYGYGYRGRGHHRDNNNDQLAGAVIGAIVGGVAGSAIGGSATNCNQARAPRQVYNAPPQQPRQVYGGQQYGGQYGYDNSQQVTYGTNNYGYDDGYNGEELYGSQYDPGYGATTTGYNAGYTQGYDSGECRTVYRDRYVNGQRVSEPATACNVGGDRWEFVD
ncbi:hypothetical protein WNY37_15930 [Henriciella sp. AS95]|uniref:hypothetical protein n=1 Tax=Henriciella sp. AS95 TaxID=3135782 RepID=UPI003178070F